MKLAWMFGAAAALSIAAVGAAQAGVEFGRPDFSNGLSRPGLVTCDWSYESYFRACPDAAASAQACPGFGQDQAEELTMWRRRRGWRRLFDEPRSGRGRRDDGRMASARAAARRANVGLSGWR